MGEPSGHVVMAPYSHALADNSTVEGAAVPPQAKKTHKKVGGRRPPPGSTGAATADGGGARRGRSKGPKVQAAPQAGTDAGAASVDPSAGLTAPDGVGAVAAPSDLGSGVPGGRPVRAARESLKRKAAVEADVAEGGHDGEEGEEEEGGDGEGDRGGHRGRDPAAAAALQAARAEVARLVQIETVTLEGGRVVKRMVLADGSLLPCPGGCGRTESYSWRWDKNLPR